MKREGDRHIGPVAHAGMIGKQEEIK